MTAPRRILKFGLQPGVTVIETADAPRFLAIDAQGQVPVAWAEASVGTGVTTLVYLATTGEAPPPDAAYIGTVQIPTRNGPFVVHAYQQVVA